MFNLYEKIPKRNINLGRNFLSHIPDSTHGCSEALCLPLIIYYQENESYFNSRNIVLYTIDAQLVLNVARVYLYICLFYNQHFTFKNINFSIACKNIFTSQEIIFIRLCKILIQFQNALI